MSLRNLQMVLLALFIPVTSSFTLHGDAAALPEDPSGAGLEWFDGRFGDVTTAARAADRPIMIDFYATWCGPCKRLASETFTHPEVVDFARENLITIKRDAEKDEGLELAERYMVFNYPTIVFLGPDGSEIDRHVGFLPPDAFLEVARNYLANIDTYDDYRRRVADQPDDPELQLRFGEKLAHRLEADAAERHLQRVVELDPRNEQGLAIEALFALGDLHRRLATRERREEEWELAIAYTRRAVSEFAADAADDDAAREGLERIAYYQKKAGRTEAAADTYRELVRLAPDDPGTLNAFAWFCAKAGHALEEATEKAQRAVELSKGDPGIIDTLAEVYYARGMYDEAIATIQKAIAGSPDDAYLKDQLEKFEQARDGRGPRT